MWQDIIDNIKPELDKAIDFLDRELAKIHTGRPSVDLVGDIMIDCFGQKLPLKQLSSISVGGPRQIIIHPWDQSYIDSVEKGIRESGLGISPIVEKENIRLNFPPLSEEFRKNLSRLISDKKESAKRTIRHFREKAWKEIQESEREGKIREDDKFRAKDKLQELIDEYTEKIENITETKRKEILD